MRTRYMMASMTALTLAGTLSLNAQAPQTPPQNPRPTSPTTATTPDEPRQRPMTPDTQATKTTAGQTVTVTGCLKEEKDVPGRNQSAAVRGHLDNDYVLTNVKMAAGSATSGIGLGSMYEVKGLDSQLKAHLNHQIEVTGTLEAKDTTKTSSTSDIADLNGTSVKMISATCPAQ